MIGEPVRLSVRPIDGREGSRIRCVAILARRRAGFVLRISLAIVFLWFGLLKLAGVSPVVELLRSSMPFLARAPFIELLGLAEILISIGLIIERFTQHAAILMMVHLVCTLSIVLIKPGLVFAPRFPS